MCESIDPAPRVGDQNEDQCPGRTRQDGSKPAPKKKIAACEDRIDFQYRCQRKHKSGPAGTFVPRQAPGRDQQKQQQRGRFALVECARNDVRQKQRQYAEYESSGDRRLAGDLP
jgi:hypothetical protein